MVNILLAGLLMEWSRFLMWKRGNVCKQLKVETNTCHAISFEGIVLLTQTTQATKWQCGHWHSRGTLQFCSQLQMTCMSIFMTCAYLLKLFTLIVTYSHLQSIYREHAQLKGSVSGHGSWVLSVAASPDQKLFVTG